MPDGPDQRHVAQGVEQEDPGRAGGAQQQPADGRAGGASDVVVDAVEQHRIADHAWRHLLVHRRLPGRDGDRAAEGEPEDRQDQHPRVEIAEECQGGDQHGAAQFEEEADQHDLAPVVVVRQHTRDDRQQHQRQGRSDLDHRHHQRTGVRLGDHPGGCHRLRPGAEVGEQVADPDDAEGGDAERGEYTVAGVCRGGGFSFEGKVVLGGNGLQHGDALVPIG
ncbi:hypothetical protein D3C81_1206030 [compost metagenome]